MFVLAVFVGYITVEGELECGRILEEASDLRASAVAHGFSGE